MVQNHPENHPNGYTSRELAFADARIAVAKLCALDRSPAYKAAVTEVLRAIDEAAASDTERSAASTAIEDEMWALAVGEVGTVRVPPYGFPVIVLARPAELGALFRAVAKKFGGSTDVAATLSTHNRERLLYVGRVLRALADLRRDAPVGCLSSEAACCVRAIRYVLGVTEANSSSVGLAPAETLPPGTPTALGELMAGWKEAAYAWRTCAGIHRTYAKHKDPSFAQTQLDFTQRALTASGKCTVIAEPSLAFDDI